MTIDDRYVEHVRVGDLMQSSLSRLAEWVSQRDIDAVPYEVAMAVYEGRSAVAAWTEARRGDA